MSQPRRTRAGFLRRMQMSRHDVFAFVEGKEADGYFVGGLCARAFGSRGLSYNVCTATDLSVGGGGKDVLIGFYRYLRSRRSLQTTLHGKKTCAVFFLDKDVDDITRTKCRSKTVVYTQFYDVQSHLFASGDFTRSVACACSVPEETVRTHAQFGAHWSAGARTRWHAWASLCLFCQLHGIRHPNYRVYSQVNSPENGPVDATKYRLTVDAIFRRSGWSRPVFDARLRDVEELVTRLEGRGAGDRVFKGKWYSHILELDLRADAVLGQSQVDGFAKRIPCCLASTLDFNGGWASPLVGALERAVT